MPITTNELLQRLSYQGCDCKADHKKKLGVINGFCPKHGGKLLVDGKTVEQLRKEHRDRHKQSYLERFKAIFWAIFGSKKAS